MQVHRERGITVVLTVLAVAVAVALSTTRNSPSAQATQVDAPGTASMRAYRNPETGGIDIGMAPVAAPTLDPDTQNALRRDTRGLVEVRHADGSVSMDLQGRYQSVSVARIDAAGRVTVCTDDVDRATDALHRAAPIATTPEVR
jgi:hypothetical protein